LLAMAVVQVTTMLNVPPSSQPRLFDDVDLAHIDAALPGTRRIQGHEHGIAGVDRQVAAIGGLQGDAAFEQVHQFMQFVRA